MHGSYFPAMEREDIIGSPLFIFILLLLCVTLAVARWLFPRAVSPSLLKGFLVASGLLTVWEILLFLKLLNPVLLPPPTRVFSNIVYLWSIGFLQPQIVSTLFRLSYAFVLALLSAVTLGILIGYFSGRFSSLESLIDAARLIPAPAWLSLAILWFGIGYASAIFIIWLGCFFPIFLNTVNGVSKAEPVQVETVLTFGGDKFDVLLEVILPVSYHHILTGARIGLGIGWITVITAELASVDIGAGLGWMIQDSRILLDTTTVLSGIIVVGMLGTMTDLLLKKCERFVQGWS
ncbi:MAG: ABC transporter permease subunit [Nitrospirae bacterium]|nr:ABC transporter permease subunit [Nitrospirota bacterium]